MPERPQRTRTPPSVAALPMSRMMMSQIWSGVFPITSMFRYSGERSIAARMPFSMEICTPAASLFASSSSRARMSSASNSAKATKSGFFSRSRMIVALVFASCFRRMAKVSFGGGGGGGAGAAVAATASFLVGPSLSGAGVLEKQFRMKSIRDKKLDGALLLASAAVHAAVSRSFFLLKFERRTQQGIPALVRPFYTTWPT